MQQDFITVTDQKDKLRCLNYSWQASHPGPQDFYRGIVVDDKNVVVARSFPWSPTIITNVLPMDDSMYTPLYEGTVLRFYRYDGKPYISTHKRIDISNGKSRVRNNKPFYDLVVEAISGWSYTEKYIDTPTGKVLESTPTKWEDLCIDGYCNVFLLIDEANALTDLNTAVHGLMSNKVLGKETFLDTAPRLIHVMSLKADGAKMTPQLHFPSISKGENSTWIPIVPRIPSLNRDEAASIMENGGAVIGFDKDTPDDTVKYLSEEYNYKLYLADENFNRVMRWHELMDEGLDDAEMYLNVLPRPDKEYYKGKYMSEVNKTNNQIVAAYMALYLVKRLNNEYSPIDKKLYDHIGPSFTKAFEVFRKSKSRTLMDATSIALDHVRKMKYSSQYSAYSAVLKLKRQEDREK